MGVWLKLLRAMRFFVLILLLIATGYAFLIGFKHQHDTQAQRVIRWAMSAIDHIYASTGRFPKTLADLIGFKEKNQKILLVFPAPNIEYRLVDGYYRIGYSKFPLGPFYGFDSKNQEWYYEE